MARMKIKSGDYRILRDKTATANVYFDWRDTTWEKDMPLENFFKETWAERITAMNHAFVEGFEKRTLGMHLVFDQAGRYAIFVKPTVLYRRQSKWSWGMFHIDTHGVITVIDNSNGQTVLVCEIDAIDGDDSYDPMGRLTTSFLEVGAHLARVD